MAQQPKVFKKNYLDLDNTKPTITITDATATNNGQSFVNFMRNRDNSSGWITTGSNDAANTEILIDLVDQREMDTIILVLHNFDSYTIQYSTDNITYNDFSTAINQTSVTDTTSEHTFTPVETRYIKIIITGTQVTDDDKRLNQLILTSKIQSGQFIGWPKFKRSTIDNDKKVTTTLSGKVHIKESTGGYSTRLELTAWPESAQDDLTMLEDMFFNELEGFLFWPCGGDDEQFRSKRVGFRKQDIYLCKIGSEYQIDWYQDTYKLGQNISVNIVEVI